MAVETGGQKFLANPTVEVAQRQSNICIKYELGSTVAFACKHTMCEKVVISSQLYTIVHFKKRVNVNTNIRETKQKLPFSKIKKNMIENG